MADTSALDYTPAPLLYGDPEIARANLAYGVSSHLDQGGLSSSISGNLTISLFNSKNSIRVLSYSQQITVPALSTSGGATTPTSTEIKFDILPDMPTVPQHYDTTVSGPTLELNQSNDLQQVYNLCPGATWNPSARQLGIGGMMGLVRLSADITCEGYIDLGYAVQASPTSALVRAAPVLRLHLEGKLTASVPILLTGTVTGDIDIVSFNGRVGAAYQLFRDGYLPGRPMMALYKPYLYYDLSTLTGSIQLSYSILHGFCSHSCAGTKTIPIFSSIGAKALPLDETQWYVYRVSSLVRPH